MMDYAPDPAELDAQERGFLALTSGFGVDWLTTRAQFARRHGVTSYHGWVDVVRLPETRALSTAPLAFLMYAGLRPRWVGLPPEYLWADHLPFDDAHRNHADIEAMLRAALGPGTTDERISNCLNRRWTFGVFVVDLHTFPPERNRDAHNTLHAREPRLATASRVALSTPFAHAYPDRSLDRVAEWVESPEASSESSIVPLEYGLDWIRLPSVEFTRRNPARLSRALERAGVVAWRDRGAGRIGLSCATTSLVLPHDDAVRLVVVDVKPGRGPGGTELLLQRGPMGEGVQAHEVRAKLASSGPGVRMDEVTRSLASVWGVPIQPEVGYDD